MLRRRLPWVAALAAVICLSIPSPANAQIGGFIKKKVKSAVKGPDQKQAPPAAQAGEGARVESPYNDYVLELTSENLDRLEKAIAAEKAYKDSVNAAYSRVPTKDQYQQCLIGTLRDPEVQKISQNANDMAAMQEAQLKLMAYREKKCGKDPERILEGKREVLRKAPDRGAEAVGLERGAVAVMKERIGPFCASGGQAKVPAATKGMFYVYSATEMAAIQPRCVKLMKLIPVKSGSGYTE